MAGSWALITGYRNTRKGTLPEEGSMQARCGREGLGMTELKRWVRKRELVLRGGVCP